MADFTPEEIASFKAYEASQAPKDFTEAEIEAFKDYEAKLADQANAIAGAEQSSPVVGGALGAAIPIATGATNQITKMVPTAKNVARHIDVPSGPQAVQGSGARNWNLAETGVAAPGTQMNKAGMDTNNRLASIVQPGGPFAGGEVTPGGIAISPQAAQELKEAKSKRPPMAKVKAGMAAAGEHPATQFGGKVAGGYGMGSNAMEAYNRLAKGEPSTRNKIAGYLNAAGSGAGAIGMAVPERFAKYRLPAVAASGALEWLANQVAEEDKKAAGGLIGHYAGGKQVQQVAELAKPVLKKFSEVLGDVGAVGKNVATTQSDRTIVGKGQKGGPGFPGLQHTDPEHAAANAVWGVGKPEPATLMVNANKRDPNGGLIWTNYVGAPEQLSSNPMVIGELWDAFMAAAREGKLSPEQLKKMNARLSSDVKGNLFDKSVDITDPRFLDVANTFDKRRLAGDVIGGIGVGGPTKGRIVPYDDILSHYTDPAFIGQPTGVIGNRLFTLDNTVTHNPDIHAGFPYILGGKDLNVQFAPVPGEIGMRDFVAGKLKQKADKGVKPEMGTYDWIRGTPTQPITEEFLKYLQKEGFAKGGKVGAIKSLIEEAPKVYQGAKDLILPPAENAARTQIIGTLPTYQKAGNMFKEMGGQGKTLDFGAGLGEGAKVLNADTFEPFAKNWSPTFTNASDIPSDAYGQLTNLNVLNVMPREMRDQTVSDIGRVMDKGGLGILTTRGKDVMNAQGRPGPEPTSIITSRDTYQKGFSPQELEEYLKYILGSKFDINKVNLGPAGAVIRKKAKGGAVQAFKDAATPEFIKHSFWYENNLPPMLDKYKNKIGAKRVEGGPRDSAAEFAGAADYGQRAPADYYRALDNAKYYQDTYHTGKNAADNYTQDAAGLALGMCNPNMSKEDIVKQAVQYGLSNDFSK